MKQCIHPTFQKTLQKEFFVMWLVCALSIGSALFFLKSGHPVIGWGLSIMFVVFCVSGLLLFSYKLHHVMCLVCGEKTKPAKDLTKSRWVTHCDKCHIEWDLQTEVGGD